MKLVLNLFVLCALAYSGYVGYKRGIVSGLLGVAAISISVYVAFLVSNTYASEFVGLINPFVSGIVDTAITDTVGIDYDAPAEDETEDAEGEEEEDDGTISILLDPVMTLSETEKKDPYMVCVASLRRIGISQDAAEKVALRVSEKATSVGQKFIDIASEEFSLTMCRVAIFTISFILATIFFAVIGNIFNLNFGLPGIELVNSVGGAVVGAVRGIAVIMVIACLLRYTGIILSEEKITSAKLIAIFIENNIIATKIGI